MAGYLKPMMDLDIWPERFLEGAVLGGDLREEGGGRWWRVYQAGRDLKSRGEQSSGVEGTLFHSLKRRRMSAASDSRRRSRQQEEKTPHVEAHHGGCRHGLIQEGASRTRVRVA